MWSMWPWVRKRYLVGRSNRFSIAVRKSAAISVTNPASTKTSPSSRAIQVRFEPLGFSAMTTDGEISMYSTGAISAQPMGP